MWSSYDGFMHLYWIVLSVRIKSYTPRMALGWVTHGLILIFGWTTALNVHFVYFTHIKEAVLRLLNQFLTTWCQYVLFKIKQEVDLASESSFNRLTSCFEPPVGAFQYIFVLQYTLLVWSELDWIMNTVLSRANSLFAFSLSVMAALTFGCFITTAFKDRSVPVDIHVSKVMM